MLARQERLGARADMRTLTAAEVERGLPQLWLADKLAGKASAARQVVMKNGLGLANGSIQPTFKPPPDLAARAAAELAEVGIDGTEGESVLTHIFMTARRACTLDDWMGTLGKETSGLLHPDTLREIHDAAATAATSPLQTHTWRQIYTANMFTLATEGHQCPYCSTRQTTWCTSCGQCRQCAVKLNLKCRGSNGWEAQVQLAQREQYRKGLVADMASALGSLRSEWGRAAEQQGYDISYNRTGDDRRRLCVPVDGTIRNFSAGSIADDYNSDSKNSCKNRLQAPSHILKPARTVHETAELPSVTIAASAVKSSMHKDAWRRIVRQPRDGRLRQQWADAQVRQGRQPRKSVQAGDIWAPKVEASYQDWLKAYRRPSIFGTAELPLAVSASESDSQLGTAPLPRQEQVRELKTEAVALLLQDKGDQSPRHHAMAPIEDWLYNRLLTTGAAEEVQYANATRPFKANVLKAQVLLDKARKARLTIRSSEIYKATKALERAQAELHQARAQATDAEERVAVVVPRYIAYRRGLVDRPFKGWKRLTDLHREFRSKFQRRLKLVRFQRILLSFARWVDFCVSAVEAGATLAQKARLQKLREQQQWAQWDAADEAKKQRAAAERVYQGALANQAMKERHKAEASRWRQKAIERENEKKAAAEAFVLKQTNICEERMRQLYEIEVAEAKRVRQRKLDSLHCENEKLAMHERTQHWLSTSGLDTIAWLKSQREENLLDREREARPATALATITGTHGLF
eukprot:SAG31_NODE_1847_length_7095_cov_11.530875_2_plen_750_part_00